MEDFPFYNPKPGSGHSFFYDANGNLTRDVARNISIHYHNWSNLPYSIKFAKGRLSYTYGRNGFKTGKQAFNEYNQIILDEQYFDDLVTHRGRPERILHDDGYVEIGSQGEIVFYYYLKDHLGNVRVVLTPSSANTPIFTGATDYYPFGFQYRL